MSATKNMTVLLALATSTLACGGAPGEATAPAAPTAPTGDAGAAAASAADEPTAAPSAPTREECVIASSGNFQEGGEIFLNYPAYSKDSYRVRFYGASLRVSDADREALRRHFAVDPADQGSFSTDSRFKLTFVKDEDRWRWSGPREDLEPRCPELPPRG